MKYYSTNGQAPLASLQEAVTCGLAPDKGLYMPEHIRPLPSSFYEQMDSMSFQEIAFEVAKAFFGEDIPEADLHNIVYDTLCFDCPVVKVEENIYTLELFHGPTLAFKDVGARFMARMLGYFRKLSNDSRLVNVLVATSGDTGSAVAKESMSMYFIPRERSAVYRKASSPLSATISLQWKWMVFLMTVKRLSSNHSWTKT